MKEKPAGRMEVEPGQGKNDMSVLDGNPAIPNQICSLLLGCKAWLPSLYTRKQDLSSLETKKALQDYLQKPRWGG